MKLDHGSMHLLRLAMKDAGADGWAKVSKIVWPLVEKLPDDLLEKKPSEDGGNVRLTDHGKTVLFYS